MITNAQDITENERNDFHYDATQSVDNIFQLKVHVLTAINQGIAKQLILEQLDESAVFIIIDFAMKFLACWESVRSWFGKTGNGVHNERKWKNERKMKEMKWNERKKTR